MMVARVPSIAKALSHIFTRAKIDYTSAKYLNSSTFTDGNKLASTYLILSATCILVELGACHIVYLFGIGRQNNVTHNTICHWV